MSFKIADLVYAIPDGTPVRIKVVDDGYFHIQINHKINLEKDENDAETFRLVKKGKNKLALLSEDGKYLTAYKGCVTENAEAPFRQQTFSIEGSTLKNVILYSKFLGYYLSYDDEGDISFSSDVPNKAVHVSIIKIY
ncbi:hypothetical protein TVAG_275040 [Trichomonas vaginalis G3]|uniref:Fascin-like domain-containing protein n=1 Tax=Trichomonas vaginalis (strain ATCC PRA-98 / G3) TaxID=412133 RepID=A2FNW9_TRIV3|nr:actin-crosslinking proteins family [Trichomonas vaginalis G3]EAX93389.1 hypothetical protein TVAG_275040 [Trichomonas vaginalis G3]KAI5544419.1 actin-crosslinking proteins family [Trichomonas vaginalis G3]|eukprot:XP_001306319.1 hypothetical protein [Trichomonas vaginalis G3]